MDDKEYELLKESIDKLWKSLEDLKREVQGIREDLQHSTEKSMESIIAFRGWVGSRRGRSCGIRCRSLGFSRGEKKARLVAGQAFRVAPSVARWGLLLGGHESFKVVIL